MRIRTDLSATLFLADPDEYDGGELLVEDTYGVHSVKLAAGHMVLYPSTSLHNVQPVTRGARMASFFWIQSMIRDDGQRTRAVRSGHGDPAADGRSAGSSRRRAADRRVSQSASSLGGDVAGSAIVLVDGALGAVTFAVVTTFARMAPCPCSASFPRSLSSVALSAARAPLSSLDGVRWFLPPLLLTVVVCWRLGATRSLVALLMAAVCLAGALLGADARDRALHPRLRALLDRGVRRLRHRDAGTRRAPRCHLAPFRAE